VGGPPGSGVPGRRAASPPAARWRCGEWGGRRSTCASVQTPVLRRAAQREGVGMNIIATASSGARGRRSEPQRYSERRSARAPSHRLLGGGVGGPPGGGVPGRRAASPSAAGWRLGEVRGGGPPPPRRLCPRHNHLFSEPRTNYSLSGSGAHSDSGWSGWGGGGAEWKQRRLPTLLLAWLRRAIRSPRHNHLSSEHRTNYSLSGKEADSDSLDALLLFLRRSVSPERLLYGQI